MAILYRDLYVDQGMVYPGPNDDASYTWRSGTPVAGVVPLVDLTGYTSTMKIRASMDSTTVLLTLTSGAGITLGGTAGTIAVAITAAQSATLPVGDLVFDLTLTPPGGAVFQFLSGLVHVKGTVSR
jgi:hypothetical protein